MFDILRQDVCRQAIHLLQYAPAIVHICRWRGLLIDPSLKRERERERERELPALLQRDSKQLEYHVVHTKHSARSARIVRVLISQHEEP